MSAAIFNGTAVKILKNILRFKDGTEFSSTQAASIDDKVEFSITASSGTFTPAINGTAFINTSGGAATVNLPASFNSGEYVILKDISGNALTNNITVQTPGAELIDGAATFVIDSNYGSAIIVSDGTNWYIV